MNLEYFGGSTEAIVKSYTKPVVVRLDPVDFEAAFARFNQSASTTSHHTEIHAGWTFNVKDYDYPEYALRVYRSAGRVDVFVVCGDVETFVVVAR